MTIMNDFWFTILIGAWGLGMLLMLAEMRGSFRESLKGVIAGGEGAPGLQTICLLIFLAACLLPVLLWPLFVIADIFTKKPEEGEQ